MTAELEALRRRVLELESRLAATGRYEVSAVSRGREAIQRLSELRRKNRR